MEEDDEVPAAGGGEDGAGAAGRRRPSLLRRLLFYGLLLAASFFIGIQLFNLVVMPAFVGHRKEVRVPDLVGREYSAAEDLLSRARLKLGDVQRRHDARRAGTILAQHPAGGLPVKTGREVALVVSLGQAASAVPALHGQSPRNAQMALEAAGLSPGETLVIPSETAPRDEVVATEPPAGSPAPGGAPVHMLVSAGGWGRAWMMPDLKQLDATEVERRLTEAGFAVEVESHGGIGRGRHRIVDHLPAPGARVGPGERIVLYTG